MIELPWMPKELSPNAKWSALEDECLAAHIAAGASHALIAQKSGRSVGSVKNRAWRLGLLEAREWTEQQLSVLINAYKKGEFVDIEAICSQTNKSAHAVHVKASRLGLGDKSRPLVAEKKVRVSKFKTAQERSAHMSSIQKSLIEKNGHPRRMAGKKHSDETKARIAESSRAMNANRTDEEKTAYLIKALKTKTANGTYAQPRPGASWKAAWREIGGVRKYYRSKWEANYAYYLEWLRLAGQIESWSHEPTTFWFEGVKRGCVSYLPDFLVTEKDGSEAYHEVKGWMDARSKTKIRRMAKYHPSVKLVVVDSKAYAKLKAQVSRIVPGWEQ